MRQAPRGRLSLLLPLLLSAIALSSFARVSSSRQLPEAPVTFHHVHLNSAAPPAAINFYTKTFDVTKKASLAGWDGLQSEGMYLLFNKVAKAPVTVPTSAIWHFGWGSTAMEPDYQKHLDNGISFATPLTRLNAGLQFAYMKAPEGVLVEINTAATRAFTHVHLFSAAPLCTADWYVKHLGAKSRSTRTGPCETPFAAPSEPLGVIRAPVATVRFGEISLIIYPQQQPGALVSPRGHTVDHVALSVPELTALLTRLRQAGVKVLEEVHPFGKSQQKAALIEGPDAIAIELVDQP